MEQHTIDISDYERITPEKIHPEGAQALVEGIVEKAAKDWRDGVKHERKTGKRSGVRQECERFVRSDWFTTLTGLDGRYVLRKLEKEMGL